MTSPPGSVLGVTPRSPGARLGRALGTAARRSGLGPLAVRAATAVLRRLEPGHPLLARAEASRPLATVRPLPGRAVVPRGYGQGRADLQFTHGTDDLLAAMYADPQHPLRAAADRRRRARAEGDADT